MRALCLAGITSIILSAGSSSAAQGAGKPPEAQVLYLFLSAEAAGAPDAARRAVELVAASNGAIRLRPVVLLQDFTVLKQADERSPFFKAIKEMNTLGTLSIPLYDVEGLVLAERWKIKVVPSFVLVTAGRAHAVSGAGADLKSLLECKE